MKSYYEYNQIVTSTGLYEVEDIGKCCVKITEQPTLRESWILIKTELGDTTVYQFGPTLIDENDILNKFDFHIEKFPFNENRIDKLLKKFFLSLYNITEVNEMTEEEFWDKLEGVIKQPQCI